MFIPARSNFSTIGTDRDAGPSVQTILVLGRITGPEKLKRAMFIPARSNFSTIGTDRDAGPSVQTILVLGRITGPAAPSYHRH
nr:hypothetical protein GW17_00004134 [Ipomoea trifida]